MFYPFFSFHQALNIFKKNIAVMLTRSILKCKYKVKWLYEDILIFFFKDMKTARNQFYFTL